MIFVFEIWFLLLIFCLSYVMEWALHRWCSFTTATGISLNKIAFMHGLKRGFLESDKKLRQCILENIYRKE